MRLVNGVPCVSRTDGSMVALSTYLRQNVKVLQHVSEAGATRTSTNHGSGQDSSQGAVTPGGRRGSLGARPAVSPARLHAYVHGTAASAHSMKPGTSPGTGRGSSTAGGNSGHPRAASATRRGGAKNVPALMPGTHMRHVPGRVPAGHATPAASALPSTPGEPAGTLPSTSTSESARSTSAAASASGGRSAVLRPAVVHDLRVSDRVLRSRKPFR